MQHLDKKELDELNKDLKRQQQLIDIYRNVEPICESIARFAQINSVETAKQLPKHMQRKYDEESRSACQATATQVQVVKHTEKANADSQDGVTRITTEELRTASDNAPPTDSPLVHSTQTVQHQMSLLQNPKIAQLIDHDRKLEQLKSNTTVQALSEAKMNPESTDQDINRLTREAMTEVVQIFTGRTVTTTVADAHFHSHEVQEYLDNMRELCGGHYEIHSDFGEFSFGIYLVQLPNSQSQFG